MRLTPEPESPKSPEKMAVRFKRVARGAGKSATRRNQGSNIFDFDVEFWLVVITRRIAGLETTSIKTNMRRHCHCINCLGAEFMVKHWARNEM